jgi:hypothetical protein
MVLLMKVIKKEKVLFVFFFFFFNLYAFVRSNIKLLFKQKNIDSENYTIYKNFYNKQANEIKEQTNLLIT